MSWLQGHLNWTAGLSIFVGLLFIAAGDIKIAVESIPFFSFTRLIMELGEDLSAGVIYPQWLLFSMIGVAIPLSVSGWVLKRKDRSLWWILIPFAPFGWIVFFMLIRERKVLDIKEGKLVTRRRDKKD
ncbi:MAG: hypothetical protein HY530_07845 [Chloroflexi bacterium]|nr:hypothetical protein [Chloroflexota bacterium]